MINMIKNAVGFSGLKIQDKKSQATFYYLMTNDGWPNRAIVEQGLKKLDEISGDDTFVLSVEYPPETSNKMNFVHVLSDKNGKPIYRETIEYSPFIESNDVADLFANLINSLKKVVKPDEANDEEESAKKFLDKYM